MSLSRFRLDSPCRLNVVCFRFKQDPNANAMISAAPSVCSHRMLHARLVEHIEFHLYLDKVMMFFAKKGPATVYVTVTGRARLLTSLSRGYPASPFTRDAMLRSPMPSQLPVAAAHQLLVRRVHNSLHRLPRRLLLHREHLRLVCINTPNQSCRQRAGQT